MSRSAYLYPRLYFSSLPSSFIFATTTSPQKAVVFPERKKKEKLFSLLVRDLCCFANEGMGKKVSERELPEQEIVRNRGRQTGKGLNYQQPIFYLDLDNYQFGKK